MSENDAEQTDFVEGEVPDGLGLQGTPESRTDLDSMIGESVDDDLGLDYSKVNNEPIGSDEVSDDDADPDYYEESSK